VTVKDGRGTAAGWNLTGQVSDFVGPNGVIVADNLGWRPSASVLAGTLPTAPGTEHIVTAGSPATPGLGTGLADSRSLCNSPAGASAGAAECGGGLTLGVPGSARNGTYTGVLTLTLV
jgi:X-Pro dipeptidyl-peptidase